MCVCLQFIGAVIIWREKEWLCFPRSCCLNWGGGCLK